MQPGREKCAALLFLAMLLARETLVTQSVTMATEGGGSGAMVTQSDTHLRASKWWSLHEAPYGDADFDIHQVRAHFTPQQWASFSPKRCGFDREIVRAALHGVQVALRECERQMVTERWNCSRFAANYNGDNIFGKLLWKGIPETAFVLAMLSAGVTASIASECRRSLRCCPCRMSPVVAANISAAADGVGAGDDGEGRGGGGGASVPATSITHADCDHNTKFARTFSKKLMERSERGRGVRYMAMLHNYNAGIRAVMQTMVTRCLCHGTSGSCTHRICWREVANFQAIGSYLKQRYISPVRVAQGSPVKIFMYQEGQNSVKQRDQQQLQQPQQPPPPPPHQRPRRRQRQRRLNLVRADAALTAGHASSLPKKLDLVYYETVDSNFFCHRDKFWSIIGVQNRVCNLGQGNCTHICCGGTYKIEYYKHVDNKCNCRFVWCCEVKCQTCVTDRQRKICD